jgi:hypothetical protein
MRKTYLISILFLFTSTAFAQNQMNEIKMSVNCKVEYRDLQSNELKSKEFPVTLSGHFDSPETKCLANCGEKECRLVEFTI